MMSCEKSYLNRIHRTAFLLDTEYIDIIRGNNQNAYTRKRKILLPHIFMQMLATTGKSQKNEISDFIEQVDENIEISQTGYFNARMKFNPDALRTILHDINRDVYAEKKLLKLNDYYIMLKRNLIYTGLTRAKQALFILGNPQAFLYGIKNISDSKRKTTLVNKINQNKNVETYEESSYNQELKQNITDFLNDDETV